MNKRVTLSFLLIFFFVSVGYSQKWKLTRYEAHFGIGTTNIFGDIGGAMDKNNLWGLKDIRINETGPSFYGGFRYKITDNQSIKLNLIYGIAKGSDLKSKNETYRGYSYNTSIFEPSLQYEYYFIAEDRRNRAAKLYSRSGMLNSYTKMGAYLFAGVGGVLFNPTLSVGGKVPDPKIETVTGYGTFSVVAPIGVGIKYSVDKFWSVGFELGRRIAFTDYLEGFSSVYSKANDTYYFGVFHAIYKLETDRRGVPLIFRRIGLAR